MKQTLTLAVLFIALLLSSSTLYAKTLKPFNLNTAISLSNSSIILAQNNDTVIEEAEFEDDEFEDDEFEDDEFEDDEFEDDDLKAIKDPLEPLNRVFFAFNDKLYFWVLKPAASGYNKVVPERGRVGISRFFTNIRTPIRLVNSLLQLKFKDAGTELFRFGVNSTLGILGFMDPAKDKFNVALKKEDTGQTLGFFHLGPGFYIVWPILGPSSLRDTVGMVGDSYLNPWRYAFEDTRYEEYGPITVDAYRRFNSISLNLGLYEGIKQDSLDPYIFIRDAYHQHREHLITQ